ncbi:MAG: glycosyltransferase family 4 protein [Caldilineaceae bacterium]
MTDHALKIAFICNLYPPYIVGGNEILARDVITALRARGHEVHVLTGRGPELPDDGYTHSALDLDLTHKEDIFLGGLPLTARRLIQWHLYHHPTYLGVRATLADIKPDLIIAWNLYMASAAPLIAARRHPAPFIAHPADKWLLYMLHDIRGLVPGTTARHRLGLRLIQRVIQPLLSRLARPDYLLTVSEFIRELHIRAGYGETQSIATFLGVPTSKFTYQPHEHPGTAPWRLLFVGQLWHGKGPQVAVAAMRLLQERGDLPAVELDIFGGGTAEYVRHLQSLIDDAGLTTTVHIRGFVSHEQLVREFHNHHIYLFCSLWDEPFSGGLLEAMGTGIPTIATTAGGTPEAVNHEVNGLVVAPDQPAQLADAIVRLMQEPTLYARIGQQGAADVARLWTFDRYIDRLEALYRAIVAGHQAGQPISLPSPLSAPAAIQQAEQGS